MNVLMDTHVWLWYLLGDKRLSSEHKKRIEDENVTLWLSPVSVWEAHLLIERRRITATEPAARWIRNALRALPVREAPLTYAVAIRSRTIALEHEDPADRFIVATAPELKAALLTADERLLRSGQVECIS